MKRAEDAREVERVGPADLAADDFDGQGGRAQELDLSYQHRRKGWKFYFAPNAKVDHMHRADIKLLRKVWVTYGQAHLPLIDKYVQKRVLDVVFQFIKGAPMITIPFPIRGFVYIGNFHLMHLFAFLALVGLVLSLIFKGFLLPILTLLAIGAVFYYGYQYVKWNFAMEPKDKFWVWCKMKYLTNLSFIQGGLKEFKTLRILCIEPSF